jgi:hypothetical protein
MEPNKKKRVIDLTVIDQLIQSGVDAIALVEEPAIEINFLAFKKEAFVEPTAGESQDEFIGRCMSKLVGDEGKDQDQAYAICISTWEGMNKEEFESYTDYPEAAKNNASRALKYAEENGWGSCGTPVGKVRANQLANGEPISEDTIARMASFARHKQNSDTPYGEGCGKLMWDAWGGTEGIEWASRKLEEIRKEKMQIDYPLFRTPEAASDYAENVLGCSGFHEHVIGNETYYMPCETHPEDMEIVVNAPAYIDQTGESNKKKKKPILETRPVLMSADEELLLAYFSQVGISQNEYSLEFANADLIPWQEGDIMPADGAGGRTFYKYVGPPAQRDFCRQMLFLDRLYTFEEIDTASNFSVNPGFGEGGSAFYDIWKYKGGPNCKHRWQKFYAKPDGEIVNKGPATGKAGTPMIDQPNRGYVMSKMFFGEEGDKRILVGPAMVPDMEIPRYDKKTKEIYYVAFSKDAVAKIAEKFMREQSTHNTNQDHDGSKPADTYIFESWIIEDPETDKAKTVYGYEGLPAGTWMVKMRVNNEDVWKRVKNGELKGFSVEGNFVTEEELAEIEAAGLLAKIAEIVQ